MNAYQGVPDTGVLEIGFDLSLTGSTFFSIFLMSSFLTCSFLISSVFKSLLTSPFFKFFSFFAALLASACCFCAFAIASDQ
jgi:hypothetical protein